MWNTNKHTQIMNINHVHQLEVDFEMFYSTPNIKCRWISSFMFNSIDDDDFN